MNYDTNTNYFIKIIEANYNILVDSCIDIARLAGQEVLKFYKNICHENDIVTKSDNSPVTKADLASHNLIKSQLKNLVINNNKLVLPVLSEESKNIDNIINNENNHLYWLIDPLDGTKEFISGNDEFCINIALIHHNKPIIGIVYVPVGDLVYYGIENRGAYKIINNQKNRINSQKYDKNNKSNKFRITVSRRHKHSKKYAGFFSYLEQNNINYEIISCGSAIKFGLVAEGAADIYPRFGPTCEWDSAAGDCIVHEAGGVVQDLSGNLLKYNKQDNILNPDFIVVGDSNYNWLSIMKII